MQTYDKSVQVRLLKSGLTHRDLLERRRAPLLDTVTYCYGEQLTIEWLSRQIASLDWYTSMDNLQKRELREELSELIYATYSHLSVAEVMLFFVKLKMGAYGVFYGAVTPMKIAAALSEFAAEHDRLTASVVTRQTPQLHDDCNSTARRNVTYEEYLSIKQRAEAGDTEAQQLLLPPEKRKTLKT